MYKDAPKKGTSTNMIKIQTRSHFNEEIEKPRFRLDVRKHSYHVRVIDQWNKLPKDIRHSKSINTFKSNVKAFLLDKQF